MICQVLLSGAVVAEIGVDSRMGAPVLPVWMFGAWNIGLDC